MGLEVGRLSVKVVAELRELQAGLQRSASMVKGYSAQVEGYLRSHREEWMRMGRQAAMAATVIIYALQRMAKEAAAYADEIQRAARGTGLSFQVIQQLKYAAEIAEGSLEGIVKLIAKLAAASADAARGEEKAAAAFDMLRISATDANGKLKSGLELMFELADKYKAGKISAEQYAAALDLVGMRGAASLLPMLGEGSKRMKELMAESTKFGNLTDKQIQTLDQYGDELLRVNKLMMTVKATIGEGMLPIMPMLQGWIINLAQAFASLGYGVTMGNLAFDTFIEKKRKFESTLVGGILSKGLIRGIFGREESKQLAEEARIHIENSKAQEKAYLEQLARFDEMRKGIAAVDRTGKVTPGGVIPDLEEGDTKLSAKGKALQEEKEKLLQDWYLEVIRMTDGETAYKLAALEIERKAIEEKFAKDKQVLDAYTIYYKTKLGEIKDTKSDMISEFIGAFEWKPSAILSGGGREFGSRGPLVSQRGENTVLQLTVNVQDRADLHQQLDRQLDRLQVVN